MVCYLCITKPFPELIMIYSQLGMNLVQHNPENDFENYIGLKQQFYSGLIVFPFFGLMASCNTTINLSEHEIRFMASNHYMFQCQLINKMLEDTSESIFSAGYKTYARKSYL